MTSTNLRMAVSLSIAKENCLLHDGCLEFMMWWCRGGVPLEDVLKFAVCVYCCVSVSGVMRIL